MVEITRLFWKKAFTADNFELGEINSADVDMDTWQIKSLFVNLTDESTHRLGFRQPFLGKVTVCLPVSAVRTIADHAILNQTFEQLNNLKQCKE